MSNRLKLVDPIDSRSCCRSSCCKTKGFVRYFYTAGFVRNYEKVASTLAMVIIFVLFLRFVFLSLDGNDRLNVFIDEKNDLNIT